MSCRFAENENNMSRIMGTCCYFFHVFRQRLRRRLHTAGGEDDKEEYEDIEEITIGKDKEADDKFAEVVGG